MFPRQSATSRLLGPHHRLGFIFANQRQRLSLHNQRTDDFLGIRANGLSGRDTMFLEYPELQP